ncbi:sporulation domain-containing protein [Streptomyces antnestii]|uniref:Sporulation domain-containing protein n=1 Tax=Streptomyces antnestii TaxID=2494256 RepID=A0A437P9K3_9ACTN|nr:phosphodiester glycosidase family protein [Streptomyces sp. San01]RVU18935.1 sporulation domain-containing protein [Streptomyces sp. San01]
MKSRLFGLGTVLVVLAAVGATSVPASSAPSSGPAGTLPLGPAGLPETRTTQQLQPGVTLTRIVRGADAPALGWTVEVSIPAGAGSPDPDAPPSALNDRASADKLVADLRAATFDARAEQVTTARTADFAGGTLGWRVRVGQFDSQSAATAERTRLRTAGYTGAAVYRGWDGEPGSRGPWKIDVLTIDPHRFHGALKASYGPDLENREKTSELMAAAGANAGINAGFFVLDPKAGAPGDPAGVGVYDGRVLSEPVSGRPALVVHDSGSRTGVTRLTWQAKVTGRAASLPLDGINRVPGLIRNCGGTADDKPTALPLHDVTCTDDDELVAFTPEFGKRTPSGEGVEAVIDRHGRVVEARSPRGGPLPKGGSSVQATGQDVARLSALAKVGQPLRVQSALKDEQGGTVSPPAGTSVLNGGPELVRDGREHVTVAADGMVQPGNPSFYYGWVHKRNPRTLAGTDAAGRTVLVTADGRSTGALGLSIPESAAVAKALGLRDAINLDGGGSTTMVVDGQVINVPSDATGERPVGDALLILPERS